MEKLGNKTEEAAQKQDMAKLYKITTSLACGFKDNDGDNNPPKWTSTGQKRPRTMNKEGRPVYDLFPSK